MASERELEIAAKLIELGDQKAVVELGYPKSSVSHVAKKLRTGKIKLDSSPEEVEGEGNEDGGDGDKKDGSHLKKTSASPTETLKPQEASYIKIVPKSFTMTSRIFWDAYEAVINHWPGWQGMSPSEFLDNYLSTTLLQRGIYVGGYLVLNKTPEKEEVNA